MGSIRKRIGTAAVVGILLAAWPAQGQTPFFQVAPGLTLQQYAFNLATVGRAYAAMPPHAPAYNAFLRAGSPSPFQTGFGAPGLLGPQAALAANPLLGNTAAGLATNPYLSGMGYTPYLYPDYYGYLSGASAVIKSQGQFLVNKQQAALMNEQVRQARLDTRRKTFDQFLYEREKTPTLEEERERTRVMERDRSRTNPPLTEVLSGKALNDLLQDIQVLQARPTLATFRAPQVALEPDDLRRINVTSNRGGSSLGLLKNDGRVTWPVALSGPEYREDRERLNTLAQEAVKAASFHNAVDAGTLRTMSGDLDRLGQKLLQEAGNMPPPQYIEARRFLNQFADSVRALEQGEAGNQLNRKLRGNTVADIVDQMTKAGLWFAPAAPGDESAYVALHRALAAYDVALQRHTGATPTAQQTRQE